MAAAGHPRAAQHPVGTQKGRPPWGCPFRPGCFSWLVILNGGRNRHPFYTYIISVFIKKGVNFAQLGLGMILTHQIAEEAMIV